MKGATVFKCPTCEARYKVVCVEAPPSHDRQDQLLCLDCGGPLRDREGKFALKYFHIDGSRRRSVGGRKPNL
jgi:hypothetical protein